MHEIKQELRNSHDTTLNNGETRIRPSLLLAASRLLRAFQDQTFYRMGGTQPVHTNVRFIAAMNKDIRRAIQQGTFREDLYYRLAVIVVALIPLRERMDNVPALPSIFSIVGSEWGFIAPGPSVPKPYRGCNSINGRTIFASWKMCGHVPVSCVPRTSLSPRAYIGQLRHSACRPRPKQALLPVMTMRVWPPTVGRLSKKHSAEMDGTKPEHPKSLAFNEPTSRNCSVRKTSQADRLRIHPHRPRTILPESGTQPSSA